jgi:flagellin-like hook-associated protein FlgL
VFLLFFLYSLFVVSISYHSFAPFVIYLKIDLIGNGILMAEEMDKTVDSEQGSNYKRKLDDDSSVVAEDGSTNLDDDFPPYEFTNSSELGLDSYTEEPQLDVVEVEDWEDPIATQLEELLMTNLETIFSNAIKKVVDLGYNEEMAELAISRKALYTEGDLLSNIVCHIMNNLKGKGDTTADFVFQNLKQLQHYTLVEMIGILRELRPSLTVTEAMWELLIHDLSITRAITGDDESSGDVSSETSSDKSGVPPSKSELQSFDIISDFSLTTSQKGSQESKPGSNSKLNSRKELALALRQKFLHMEKTKACGKGGVKLAKLTSVSGLIVEKRLKPQSEIPNQKTKRGSSYKGVSIAGVCHVSVNDDSALPEACSAAKLPAKDATSTSTTGKTTKPKPKPCSSATQKIQNYCAGIPFDEGLGKYVPRDEKDEQILKLVSRAQELQDEVQSWNDWANKKVMQAADKLRRLQAESKSLKKEAEVYRKERKALEENAEKRISEVEHVMENNEKQLENASSSILILEAKKSLLEKDLEAAKSLAEKSMTTLQEALEREQVAIRKVQSWETEKGLLQDELEKEKKKLSNLQQEIQKGKNLLANTEVCGIKYDNSTHENIFESGKC